MSDLNDPLNEMRAALFRTIALEFNRVLENTYGKTESKHPLATPLSVISD